MSEAGAATASVDPLADGARVIRFRGELDMANAGVLRESLEATLAKRPPILLIDFSECDFIDSTGLALLVGAARDSDDGEGATAIGLIGIKEQVRRVLELTGITEMLPTFEDETRALKELGERPAAA
jgi:anti-anti-sigma factor